MASDHSGESPHGSEYMDEDTFAEYLGPEVDQTDPDSENNDHDMERVQSPAEASIDENAAPTIDDVDETPQEVRPRPLPFMIPEGAEVIDLDMLDDDSFTFVYDVDEGVMIKEEPVETAMVDIEKHQNSLLRDDEHQAEAVKVGVEKQPESLPRDDEPPRAPESSLPVRPINLSNPSNPTVDSAGDMDDAVIKGEYDSDCSSHQFVWSMEMPREHIVISDDEDDVSVHLTVDQTNSSPEVEEPVSTKPIPPFKKLLLTKKKPRPQLTDAEKAKMTEIQARLAAQVTGKTTAGGDGLAFRGPGANVQPAGPTVPAEPEDPYAWMHGEVEVEDDDETLRKFEALKKRYKVKKHSGKADLEDDINFQRAERAERARVKRLEDERMRVQQTQPEAIVEDGDEEDGLFVPLADPSQAQQKRNRNDNVDDYSDDDGDGEPTNKRSKQNPSEKKLHAKILNDGLLAAIDAEMAKQRMADKKEKENPKGSGAKKTGDKKKSSKRKPKTGPKVNETSADKPKLKKPRKKSGANGAKGKGKGKAKQPTLLNVNSLLHSNVYADANASLDSAPIPLMTEKRKADALKQLLASVPLEDQRMANREKEHILKATIQLGKRRVKPDGNGGWSFKGMKSSLKNHQVQGAAWMRERETGTDEPLGGLCGDEMGFGKTVQMLACMVANPPAPNELSRPTLIVATPAICLQWAHEIEKHVDAERLGDVIRHHGSSKLTGSGAVKLLQKAGVILTTYHEVLRSYPKYDPPKEIMTHNKKMDWWKDHYAATRGILHHLSFFRVVLDEAQAIKNHLSQTSIACRGLVTKHRWAMSGTPIQNSVEELYPYFKFLHVKHTGTFEVFKENFCDKESGVSNERLHSFLRQFLIRRTHQDRLFGAPLISLPKNNEKTVYLEFNEVERSIYEVIRHRYIKRINEWRNSGVLNKSYSNVLTMLLRLRQLTAHVFLLQDTIEDLFELEDVERIWENTAAEVETAGSERGKTGKDMLVQMRKMIADKGKAKDGRQGTKLTPPVSNEDDAALEESQPLVFKFRKFLRDLCEGSKWDALARRSLCHKCRDVPQDPQVTDCLHIYCKECLRTMTYEAAQDGEDHAACLECGSVYNETRPCSGLKELGHEDTRGRSDSGTPTSSRRPKRDPEEDTKWVSMEGGILPSTKSTAMVAQIEKWLKEDSKCKIIIFTQWHLMIKIIGRTCGARGWGFCTYHGKMSHDAREKTIDQFRKKKDIQIMVASLKCGGVGLNLTCASRVINIDLFWNASVEMQAFCRVFRIGQEKETFITRFVVKNTVDEKLKALQEDKKETIDAAIGDDGKRLAKLTLEELLRLFGPVRDEDGGKEFILVEDEDEYADTMPTIANEHEDNAYVPPPNM